MSQYGPRTTMAVALAASTTGAGPVAFEVRLFLCSRTVAGAGGCSESTRGKQPPNFKDLSCPIPCKARGVRATEQG